MELIVSPELTVVSTKIYNNKLFCGNYLHMEKNIQAAIDYIASKVNKDDDRVYILNTYEGLMKVPKDDIVMYYPAREKYLAIENNNNRYDFVLDLFSQEALIYK